MKRRITLAVTAALAVASLFAFTTSATASTYTVNLPGCSQFSSTYFNGWANGYYCGPYGATWLQLNSTVDHTVGAPGPALWAKTDRIRNGAYLQSLTLDYASSQANYNGTDAPKVQVRGCLRYQGAADVWSAGPYGTCTGQILDIPNHATFSVTAFSDSLLCGTNCGGYQINADPYAASGYIAIRASSLNIVDNGAPSASAANLIGSGWLRASATINGAGHDDGGGVKSLTFVPEVDFTKSVTADAGCDFTVVNPCPTDSTKSFSFDTTTVPDGTQSGHLTVTDAAGNAIASTASTFKVDNTKPATPADIKTDTTGMNGWSSVNSFGASWSNTGETTENSTQSGISEIIVDVDPTSGSQTDPAPVTVPVGGSASGISATIDSVSGVSVPAEGTWTLKLRTKDRAGNVSDLGAGNDPAVDGVATIGWDSTTPAKPFGQANGWISRDELAAGYDQSFTYSPSPLALAPICGFAAAVDQDPSGLAGTAINVPGGSSTRAWRLPGTLIEATHWVHLRAISCTGNPSPQSEPIEAKVDRTDPVGTITGVENGHWYRDGQAVTLSGSDELSGMAPAPDDELLSTAGAYLSYSINGIGPHDIDAPRGSSTTINVTGEGQKELKFSPVDLAGNKAAAKTVTFGIDATNPIGFVASQDPARPTLLAAELGDVPSGVSYAIFQIRKSGSGDSWENLPTSLAGANGEVVGAGTSSGLATARFPDTSKEAGTYDVRVSAFDQAGNSLTTQRHKDGSLATVENPMRAKSSASIKLFKTTRTCKTKRTKHGKRIKCVVKKCPKGKSAAKSKGLCLKKLRGKQVLLGGSSAVTSEYKRGATAIGQLVDEAGSPLKNTQVTLTSTERFSGKHAYIGEVTTDKNGLYAIRIPGGVNREIRASYEGTELRRPAVVDGDMKTRAKVTLKISKKRERTGQSVRFSGKVTPFDGVIPAGGKIVALQFYAAKKWRPAVGVAHTGKDGKFKIAYKFDGAKVKAKIIFRVVAPSEDGWGHTTSYSKTRVIRLNF